MAAKIAEKSLEKAQQATIVVPKHTIEFVVDSGCTQTMVTNISLLTNLREQKTGIIAAGGHQLESTHVGTIIGKLNGKPITLSNVLVVPELQQSLLSVAACTKDDMELGFERNENLYIKQNGLEIARTKAVNNTYYIYIVVDNTENARHTQTDNYMLWHCRLGHPSPNKLNEIAKAHTGTVLKNLKPIENFTCDGCLAGKQSQRIYPSSSSKAEQVLDLVHSDVCGPFRVTGINGQKYFVTFIDDFSRFAFTYTMNDKTSKTLFSAFQNFLTIAENQTDKHLKTFLSDNGTEYSAIHEFLDNRGVRVETSVRYTPQQNGRAERFNRSISERLRATLIYANAPPALWPEFIHTLTFLVNITPHSSIENKIPFCEFYTKKTPPKIEFLHPLGCVAYALKPKQMQSKLESKTIKTNLVGYSFQSKGFRVFDPETFEIFEATDV
jgi:transposase InsO family protein